MRGQHIFVGLARDKALKYCVIFLISEKKILNQNELFCTLPIIIRFLLRFLLRAMIKGIGRLSIISKFNDYFGGLSSKWLKQENAEIFMLQAIGKFAQSNLNDPLFHGKVSLSLQNRTL